MPVTLNANEKNVLTWIAVSIPFTWVDHMSESDSKNLPRLEKLGYIKTKYDEEFDDNMVKLTRKGARYLDIC